MLLLSGSHMLQQSLAVCSYSGLVCVVQQSLALCSSTQLVCKVQPNRLQHESGQLCTPSNSSTKIVFLIFVCKSELPVSYSAAVGEESRRKSSFPGTLYTAVAGYSGGFIAQFPGYYFPGTLYNCAIMIVTNLLYH